MAIAAVLVAAIAVAVVFFYHPHPPPPSFHGSAPTIEPYSIVNFSGEVGV